MSEIKVQIQLLANMNERFCFKCTEPYFVELAYSVASINPALWDSALVTVGIPEITTVTHVRKAELPTDGGGEHLATVITVSFDTIKKALMKV